MRAKESLTSFRPFDDLILLVHCQFFLLISSKPLYTWSNLFFIMLQWWSGSTEWNRDTDTTDEAKVPCLERVISFLRSWVPERWGGKKLDGSSASSLFLPNPDSCITRCVTSQHQARCQTLNTWFLHRTSNLNWRCSSWMTVSVWKLGGWQHKMNKSCLLLSGHLTSYFNHRQVHGQVAQPFLPPLPIPQQCSMLRSDSLAW